MPTPDLRAGRALSESPLALGLFARAPRDVLLIHGLVEIALVALRTPRPGVDAEVLAEVLVALGCFFVVVVIVVRLLFHLDVGRDAFGVDFVFAESALGEAAAGRFQGWSQCFSADVAHRVAAEAGEFVAAGGFDEGEAAAWAGAFHRCRAGCLDCCAEVEELGFVADVRIAPGFLAGDATRASAGGVGADESFGSRFEAEVAEGVLEYGYNGTRIE